MYSSRSNLVGVCALLLSVCVASAQGTFQRLAVTFDGPPLQRRGTGAIVQQYSESGVWFVPIPGSDGFTRMGGGIAGFPDNGSAYLQASLGDSLMFGVNDGTTFGLVSVDLAEYSDVLRDPTTVRFVGYRQDGTVVTTDIATAGIFDGTAPVFQTFSFGPDFTSLARVVVPFPLWSLDNLVLSVPEPGTSTLLVIGAGLVALGSSKRKRGS